MSTVSGIKETEDLYSLLEEGSPSTSRQERASGSWAFLGRACKYLCSDPSGSMEEQDQRIQGIRKGNTEDFQLSPSPKVMAIQNALRKSLQHQDDSEQMLYCKLKKIASLVQRGEAIEHILSPTHVCYWHGQGRLSAICAIFLKELAKKQYPHRDFSKMQCLRSYSPNPDVAWKIEKYTQEDNPTDDDPVVQKDLISVLRNGWFYAIGESALSIVLCNHGMHREFQVIPAALKEAISNAYPDLTDTQISDCFEKVCGKPVVECFDSNRNKILLYGFLDKLVRIPIKSAASQHDNLGDYVLICVPRSIDSKVAYYSYGGIPLNRNLLSSLFPPHPSEQFRLGAPTLRRDVSQEHSDLRIYRLSSWDREDRKELKGKIRTIIAELEQPHFIE